MHKKSTPPSSQSGATMLEILTGLLAVVVLGAITIYFVQSVRSGNRIERTLSAVYSLKETVKQVNRGQGSYPQDKMMPILFAAKAFPDTLDVDYDKKYVTTPLGTPLSVTGRGRHFSIDLYGLSPKDCRDFGAQIVAGNFFALGNYGDDFDIIKIGDTAFDDAAPLSLSDLEKLCADRLSIDVIMAFR